MNAAQPLQRRASQIARLCLAHRIRLLNRIVSNIYDKRLGVLGITVAQFNMLTLVAKYQPVKARMLSTMLQLEKSSLSRNLNGMRTNGWIRTTGKKELTVSATAEGYRVFEAAIPSWELAQHAAGDLLGQPMSEELLRTVEAVYRRSEHDDE